MQRDKVMDARLQQWGSWAASGGRMHSKGTVSSIYAMRERPVTSGDALWTGLVPFDALEAEETDRAVRQLDPIMHNALRAVYVSHVGHFREVQARVAGCSTTRQLHNLLCAADAGIRRWLDERHAGATRAAA